MTTTDAGDAVETTAEPTDAPASDAPADANDSAPTESDAADGVDAPAADPSGSDEPDDAADDAGSDAGADDAESSDEPADDSPTYEGLALSDEALKDDIDLDAVREFAKAIELTEEQAAAVLKRDEERVSQDRADLDAMADEWAEEWKADREIGGKNEARTLQRVRAAREAHGSAELTQWLEDTGFGDHPEVVRFFESVGAHLSEPGSIGRGGRAGGSGGPAYRGDFEKSLKAMEANAARGGRQ